MFKVGDPIIYRKTKYSGRPGRRARCVSPAAKGDEYSYFVDKLWVVERVRLDGKLIARTRRGKMRIIGVNDPNLRHANVWDRIKYRHRFPAIHSHANH